jgi:DNA-binding MarR family transcriptional regulator
VNDSTVEPNESGVVSDDALLDDLDAVVFRLARLMATHLEHRASAWTLSPPQYMVLKTLEREGTLRVSDVAEHMGVGAPAASMILHALTEEGLIDREQDSQDRRATLVSVSESGRSSLARAEEERRAFMKDVTSRLSPEDIRVLIRGLSEIAEAIAAVGD